MGPRAASTQRGGSGSIPVTLSGGWPCPGKLGNRSDSTLTARGRRLSRYLARESHTAVWTWWSNTPPGLPSLNAISPAAVLGARTTSAGCAPLSPIREQNGPSVLTSAGPSSPESENSVCSVLPPRGSEEGGADRCSRAPPPWPFGEGGGLGELRRDDVEQRAFGGCGVWRGGRDGGLHERSGLLPPSAAAPRGPAVPAAGNALVWDRLTPSPSLEPRSGHGVRCQHHPHRG